MARSLWALPVLAILIAAGVGYEQVERRRDRARFPQVGRSVDIGGRSLNIYCSGEGGPAVVLESDALTPGFAWVAVQRELAKFARACWYDRAGYGWSDPSPSPHPSSASARDLHALLRSCAGCEALRLTCWRVQVSERSTYACTAGSIRMKWREWCWWTPLTRTNGMRNGVV